MGYLQHYQPLESTNSSSAKSLNEHLRLVHSVVSSRYPAIDRIAMATYDASTDNLTTFISSNQDGIKLDHYSAKLADVPSLLQLVRSRRSRTIDELDSTLAAPSAHTQWLKERAYRSSFTVPLFHGEELSGFLFFDSKQPTAFDAEITGFLEIFADLVAQLYFLQLQVVHGIAGAVQVASRLARIRDMETGQHLERIAAYSRLIGMELARSSDISDEFIEYLFLFAPLHDIGKVGIPDRVLLKPGKLNGEEWAIMQRHVEIGESLVEQMAVDLKMNNSLAFDVMRNIVAAHHERGDGKGYPRGLVLADIPLEAKIVAVADVYDALSNRRPYKEPWSEEEIRQELEREVSRGRLDAECVRLLMQCTEQRARIAAEHADAQQTGS